MEDLEAEAQRLREANRRLHRRAQTAESRAEAKWRAVQQENEEWRFVDRMAADELTRDRWSAGKKIYADSPFNRHVFIGLKRQRDEALRAVGMLTKALAPFAAHHLYGSEVNEAHFAEAATASLDNPGRVLSSYPISEGYED